MSGHTPGPWLLEQSKTWPWTYMIFGAEETKVLNYALWTYSTKDTQDTANARTPNDVCAANAKLIASAPDLLEALRHYASSCDATETAPCGYEGNRCCKVARAAIAKAEGKS